MLKNTSQLYEQIFLFERLCQLFSFFYRKQKLIMKKYIETQQRHIFLKSSIHGP